ncbi:MAG: LysR family transcriptional regulator [Pseudomonadota bacterium]
MTTVRKVDLNLFRLFEALYEERSVARTAERLFLTPSAVSHALKRLRLMVGDDLFKRGPHGMMPTPRAHEVARQLRLLLPKLSEVLSPLAFDAGSSERIFALACVPYLSRMLIPDLAARFSEAAPHARLDIRLLYSSIVDDLDNGTLDVALGNFRKTPSRLVTKEILREPYVWVMRRSNPFASQRLTLATLSKLAHVDLLIDGAVMNTVDSYDVRQGLERLVAQNSIGATENALVAAGLPRLVRYHAPDSVSALAIVARTDAACLVPRSVARMYVEFFDLTLFDPPYAMSPLVIQMLYHAENGQHPAVHWLLEQVQEAVSPDLRDGVIAAT